MPQGRFLNWTALIVLVLVTIFIVPIPHSAQAQTIYRPNHESNDNCISCHENLYFLHDTGKWYCLRESPMTCTECHGGDPLALTQEEAHTGRATHPVVNEDISKCQECHPKECNERVDMFDQAAGIREIKVALPLPPVPGTEPSGLVEVHVQQETGLWLDLFELLPIGLLAGAAILVYSMYWIRHRRQAGS